MLLNQRTLSLLEPHVDSCFTFFASDLSLGHCIQQHIPNVTMIEIPDETHMFSRTVEEVVANFGLREAVVWMAGAFHHMREPFIAKWGVDTRLEVYLRESEMRGFASYVWTVAEMEKEAEKDVVAGRSLSIRGGAAAQNARKMRVLLAMQRDAEDALSDVPTLVAAMLRRDGWQPLSFLSSLHLDTDVLLIDAVESTACSHCDVYGDEREKCLQLFADKHASLLLHIQTAQPTSSSARQLKVRDMTYGDYDLVLSMDAILSPSDAAHALYVHFTHPPCSFARPMPPVPYSFALINELALLDELSSASVVSHSYLLPFPSLSLYYGVYHSLGLSAKPYLHADRSPLLLALGSESEKATYTTQLLGTAQLTLSLLPVSAVLDLSTIRELTAAKLCVFTPDLTSASSLFSSNFTTTRTDSAVSTARRSVSHLVVAAIAGGCLTVVSAEVASWGLKGERLEESSGIRAAGAVGVGVLLGGAAVVSDLAALRTFVERVNVAGSREYGVELAYQRTALNSHMMEKPWHNLLTKMKQHRDRLQAANAAATEGTH